MIHTVKRFTAYMFLAAAVLNFDTARVGTWFGLSAGIGFFLVVILGDLDE